ncbi:hypothetical protein D3C87_2159910 [compost metagenome]
MPFLRLRLADGEFQLLVAGKTQLLAELDDARLAAPRLGGKRCRGKPQHLVRIVEDELADLPVRRCHVLELRGDLL